MELFDALLPINLLALAYLLLFTAGRRSDRAPGRRHNPRGGPQAHDARRSHGNPERRKQRWGVA